MVVLSVTALADQPLPEQEDLSLYNEVYQFRAYYISESYTQKHGSVSEAMYFFSASYRSSLEVFSYWRRHLENIRSVTKFYRTHQIHISGRTQLNEILEMKLGISSTEYEDIGLDSSLHKTHPTLEIKFRNADIKQFYSSNAFEKALLNLREVCLKINDCQGIYIRAAQGITPYYFDAARYNPGSLSVPSDQQFHQLLLSVEWHDSDGHVLDAISYSHGFGSMNNYEWLESLYKSHEIGQKSGGIFTLLSPEVIDNTATMITYAVTHIESNYWHRPCARRKSQGFMSLYHARCLRYEKKLPSLNDVKNTLNKINSAISVTVAKDVFLVFDYYARWFNYPAILLIIR